MPSGLLGGLKSRGGRSVRKDAGVGEGTDMEAGVGSAVVVFADTDPVESRPFPAFIAVRTIRLLFKS
jgi:hypothetical protein